MQSGILAGGCSGTRRIISGEPYSKHLFERGLSNMLVATHQMQSVGNTLLFNRSTRMRLLNEYPRLSLPYL